MFDWKINIIGKNIKITQNKAYLIITSGDNIMEKNKRQEFMRALKFVLFSISAGVIQILTFTLLNEIAGWSWWPSHLISLALSVVWNFTFNRKFTFKSAVNVPKAMLIAFLFYVPFTPATVFGGQALVNIGWNSYLVEGLTMLLNFVLEYFYSKYVTFRNNIDTANTKKETEQELDGNNDNNSVLIADGQENKNDI